MARGSLKTVRAKPGYSIRRGVVPTAAMTGALAVLASVAVAIPRLLQSAQERSALTGTESEGALTQGSVINFVTSDRSVRLEVSLDSAEKSRLKVSSRLLAVAQQVIPGTP
ncbi:MAG TPA: YfiR family protein [Burkholderiales bacterium]|nr:YfiR family protein [Burkholderiales bacterium]